MGSIKNHYKIVIRIDKMKKIAIVTKYMMAGGIEKAFNKYVKYFF